MATIRKHEQEVLSEIDRLFRYLRNKLTSRVNKMSEVEVSTTKYSITKSFTIHVLFDGKRTSAEISIEGHLYRYDGLYIYTVQTENLVLNHELPTLDARKLFKLLDVIV